MFSAATIFLSAFLLFGVQPLIARQITPWFGGSAAVWTTCMLFFQVVLLLGYLYAHAVTSKLIPARQARLHRVLALLSLLSLPIIPGPAWKPVDGHDPTLRVLLVLAVSVGLPYWTLSTTNPLLSSWFSRRYTAAQSYRLFALSNAGALLALLSYPVLVEPRFTIREQAYGWSAIYAVFVALVSWVAHQSPRFTREFEASTTEIRPSSPWLPIGWVGLSACSSVLLISVTNYLSQNVAAIPFLWIVPLALYLLSYIFSFSYAIFYQRWLYWPLAGWAFHYLASNLSDESHNQSMATLIPMLAGSLFVLCMLCHGELARSKPEAGRLTQFYLLTSVGGALGGIFVGIVSPLIFSDTYELPLALWACPLLAAFTASLDGRAPAKILKLAPVLWIALVIGLGLQGGQSLPRLYQEHQDAKINLRNFYGPLKVEMVGEGADLLRRLDHGTIQHGSQFIEPGRRRLATSYYSKGSGVGQAVLLTRREGVPQHVGVVGLGTGTVASYGRAGDEYVYYEINPLVEKLARSEFTYLADNPGRTDVVLGDARLSLERETRGERQVDGRWTTTDQGPRTFDVLAVDAFSSDSIPIHLLTQEALALYFCNIKQDGVLAVHISNRYLDLQPVLSSFAAATGRIAVYIHNKREDDNAITAATWLLLGAPDNPTLRKLRDDENPLADDPAPTFRAWTDDYSNLLSVIDAEELAQFYWLKPARTPSPTPDIRDAPYFPP